MTELACVEIGPADARHSVIWLHGLGADGHDFEPIVPELKLAPELAVRFIFPHAPQRPVTINNGYVMRAWYDIRSMEFVAGEDETGIHESARQVEALMARERQRGIGGNNMVLAGFSQGGAIALHTALRHPEPLAGVMALSTYLPLRHTLEAERHQSNQTTPIFMAHGEYDPLVPIALAEQSRQQLIEMDYPVKWRSYAMEHGVCPQEVADIGQWLESIFNLPE